MLFKIVCVGKNNDGLDEYFVEAANVNEASKKAQKEAEKDYPGEKPITITKIETISYSDVIR